MSNFFTKLFGKKTALAVAANDDRLYQRQQQVIQLREMIGETITLYNSVSCVCAFPRLRQIAGIDCIDYRKAFYVTETEYFIDALKPFFKIEPVESARGNSDDWTCLKCGSTWVYQWEDFSISVSRTVLKIKELKAQDAGPAGEKPIPLFIGLGGHGFPDYSEMTPVAFDTFKNYMQKL